MVIDICVRSGGKCRIAVETKTLYGTTIPLIKLREVIESRCISNEVDELWIMVPQYALALYGKDIIQFIGKYVEEMKRCHSFRCRRIVLMSVSIEFDKEVLRPELRSLNHFCPS